VVCNNKKKERTMRFATIKKNNVVCNKNCNNVLLRAAMQGYTGRWCRKRPRLNVIIEVAIARGHALHKVVHRLLARGVAEGNAARSFGETLAVAHGVIAVRGG
jgi:hypothetical protein